MQGLPVLHGRPAGILALTPLFESRELSGEMHFLSAERAPL